MKDYMVIYHKCGRTRSRIIFNCASIEALYRRALYDHNIRPEAILAVKVVVPLADLTNPVPAPALMPTNVRRTTQRARPEFYPTLNLKR